MNSINNRTYKILLDHSEYVNDKTKNVIPENILANINNQTYVFQNIINNNIHDKSSTRFYKISFLDSPERGTLEKNIKNDELYKNVIFKKKICFCQECELDQSNTTICQCLCFDKNNKTNSEKYFTKLNYKTCKKIEEGTHNTDAVLLNCKLFTNAYLYEKQMHDFYSKNNQLSHQNTSVKNRKLFSTPLQTASPSFEKEIIISSHNTTDLNELKLIPYSKTNTNESFSDVPKFEKFTSTRTSPYSLYIGIGFPLIILAVIIVCLIFTCIKKTNNRRAAESMRYEAVVHNSSL